MKRFLITFLLLVTVLSVQAQKQISYIKNDGSWYIIYDEQGKKITTVSKSSVGEVVGWGSYDKTGKLINTHSAR